MLASTAGAAARGRVTARYAAATGSLDLTAVLNALRRAFLSGRHTTPLGPPPNAASMTPDERLAFESTR
jgi:hypothetical protein